MWLCLTFLSLIFFGPNVFTFLFIIIHLWRKK